MELEMKVERLLSDAMNEIMASRLSACIVEACEQFAARPNGEKS